MIHSGKHLPARVPGAFSEAGARRLAADDCGPARSRHASGEMRTPAPAC